VENRPKDSTRLTGKLNIVVNPGSVAFQAYRNMNIEESFFCNYELNPIYRKKLEDAGLMVSGTTEDRGTRIIELPDHRFFVGTGFVPQFSSTAQHPHPLIVAYLETASAYAKTGLK
jgi:CTP synthase (UTP-ammonia lyase)